MAFLPKYQKQVSPDSRAVFNYREADMGTAQRIERAGELAFNAGMEFEKINTIRETAFEELETQKKLAEIRGRAERDQDVSEINQKKYLDEIDSTINAAGSKISNWGARQDFKIAAKESGFNSRLAITANFYEKAGKQLAYASNLQKEVVINTASRTDDQAAIADSIKGYTRTLNKLVAAGYMTKEQAALETTTVHEKIGKIRLETDIMKDPDKAIAGMKAGEYTMFSRGTLKGDEILGYIKKAEEEKARQEKQRIIATKQIQMNNFSTLMDELIATDFKGKTETEIWSMADKGEISRTDAGYVIRRQKIDKTKVKDDNVALAQAWIEKLQFYDVGKAASVNRGEETYVFTPDTEEEVNAARSWMDRINSLSAEGKITNTTYKQLINLGTSFSPAEYMELRNGYRQFLTLAGEQIPGNLTAESASFFREVMLPIINNTTIIQQGGEAIRGKYFINVSTEIVNKYLAKTMVQKGIAPTEEVAMKKISGEEKDTNVVEWKMKDGKIIGA